MLPQKSIFKYTVSNLLFQKNIHFENKFLKFFAQNCSFKNHFLKIALLQYNFLKLQYNFSKLLFQKMYFKKCSLKKYWPDRFNLFFIRLIRRRLINMTNYYFLNVSALLQKHLRITILIILASRIPTDYC